MTTPLAAHAQKAEIPTQTSEQTAPQRHGDWTHLLEKYVVESDDGINRFDYAALKASTEDRALLNSYIETQANIAPDTLSRDEKFARLANLYNALTIRLIIEHYPVESITKIKPSLFSIGPWKQNIVSLNGKEVSLDDIEHGMLRKDFSDPRVHYSVNCASLGCPNLQPKAWEAATLDKDLDAAARDYINNPRGVTVREDGKLVLSSIYKWFSEDFGPTKDDLRAHLRKFAESELAAILAEEPSIADYAYDWSLNDVSHTDTETHD